MVVRILTDSEKAVSSGLLTNLAVKRVGSMVVQILTDSEKAASSGLLTNLAVMRVGLMVVWIPMDAEMVVSLVTSLAVTMALMKV
jgi:hypothetical protein